MSAASAIGVPVFDSTNGEMMEGPGGASIAELRIRDGKRVRGVDAVIDGWQRFFLAHCETVLSLGAINTPKVLMQSGDELRSHGIPVVQHLPGVGRNHQNHLAFGCTWAYGKPDAMGGSGCEANIYWKSDARLSQPDILQCQLEFAVPSPPETGLETPEHGWTMFNGLAQPKSRGRLRLSGPDINNPILIEPNSLSEPEDMAAALAAVELCRELGRSDGSSQLVTGETAPGVRDRSGMIDFIRRSAISGIKPRRPRWDETTRR